MLISLTNYARHKDQRKQGRRLELKGKVTLVGIKTLNPRLRRETVL